MPKLTYALQSYYENGEKRTRLVNVDEVKNGLECNCICPNPQCNAPLIAKNDGEKNAHHFAHYGEDECEHGYESMLHLMAKRILIEEKQLCLPRRHLNFPNTFNSREIVKEDSKYIFDNVEEEKRLYEEGLSIIPDIVLTMNNKKLLVEIYVTHKIDGSKHNKIKELGLSAIEIDLSKISRGKEINYEWLRKILVEEIELKSWIYNDYENKILESYQSEDNAKVLKIGDRQNCIYKKWNGKQGALGKKYCSNCVYCAGIIDGKIYCTGEKMLDVTGKNKELSNEEKLKLLYQEDETDLCDGRCPKCGNVLKVFRNFCCLSIICMNYKQCDFTAHLNIPDKMIHYISRNGFNKQIPISEKIESLMPGNGEMTIYENKHLNNFKRGYCPYCNSKLKIDLKEPHAIICGKYDECFFKAIVREDGKAHFNKRYGDRGEIAMDLPFKFRYKG